MNNYKHYLTEGAFIVFTLLFALYINKLYDDYKTDHRKEVVLEGIRNELLQNQENLKQWNTKHQGVLDVLTDKGDSIKSEFQKHDFFHPGVLTNNQSFVNSLLSNTAWEAAKSTGLIAEFDFETVKTLTQVYEIQDIVKNKTIAKITDLFFDKETHNMDEIDATLTQLTMLMWELTGQERTLDYVYGEALKHLEGIE